MKKVYSLLSFSAGGLIVKRSYRRFFIGLIALCAVSFSGCDALDKEPHTLVPQNYFNTDKEREAFLLGVYAPLMHEHFYGGDYLTYDCGGDDLSFYQRSTPVTSMLCANTNSGDLYLSRLWQLLYQGANRANVLLENSDPASRYYAEALFLRAYYYFILVQGWGDVPLRLTSTKDVYNLNEGRTPKQDIYDVIVRDIELAIPYLNDFDQNATPEFISKTAAAGILARIWLFRAGECYRDNQTPDEEFRQHCFSEAKRWALYVKDSNIHDLVADYSRVFIDLAEDKYNSTGVKESMWEIPEAGNRTTTEAAAGRLGNSIGWGLNDSQIGISLHQDELGLANPGFSYNFIFASSKLYDLYEIEGDTARGDWNIAPYTYMTGTVGGVKSVTGRKFWYGKFPRDGENNPLPAPDGYTYTEEREDVSRLNHTRCSAKYRREYETVSPKNKNYTPINSPLLRYSDVLLMLAEAENELNGPTDLALGCLNKVRQRAHIDTYGATDKDSFRKLIKDERAMELCFEYGSRRWDLIRWGDYLKAMRNMESLVYAPGWGAAYQYAAAYYRVTSAYVYFPIPDSETAVNSAITTQNPGW